MSDDRRQSGLWSQNPETGFYEQESQQKTAGPYQYYQPPQRSASDKRKSYSERAAEAQPGAYRPSTNGVQRSDSRKIRDRAEGVTQKLHRHGAHEPTTSNDLAQTQHINSSSRAPPPDSQRGLRIDPNAVPDNIRNKPWSPDIISPRTQQPSKQRHVSNASNASELLRRGSVPERSPLQKLEMEFTSKGEKRARAEEAERRARQKSVSEGKPVVVAAGAGGGEGELLRHGTLRHEKGRAVSDDSRRPSGRDERPRQASAGAQQGPKESGGSKFRRAAEGLKGTEPEREHADDPRRQRHAEPTQSRGPREEVARYDHPNSMDGAADLGRSDSKYRRRARDAGFAGAAAAMAGAEVGNDPAADRGKAAYERRKSQYAQVQDASPQQSPISPTYPEQGGGLGRSGSKKLQKRGPAPTEWYDKGGRNEFKGPHDPQTKPEHSPQLVQQSLQGGRMGSSSGKKDARAAMQHQDPDPIPREKVATGPQDPINYQIPPQTAAGQEARQMVGSNEATSGHAAQLQPQEKHPRFRDMLHHKEQDHRSYQAEGKPLDDWRNAGAARLRLEDFDDDRPTTAGDVNGDKDAAWWDKNKRRTSSGGSRQAPPQMDGPYEEEAKHFRPQLYLKCGPLLRYTGLRKEAAQQSRSGMSSGGDREIWRGSIMIMTDDRQSDYSSAPTLRVFGHNMDLHTPPPQHLVESGQELPPEFEDPVAGQMKLSRTGRPLYVRHVHELDGEVDLSREENPQGLFSANRAPMLGPQSVSGPDGRQSQHITFQDKSRVKRNTTEKNGKYREVRAARLHQERGYTFWRFNLEIELGSTQHRVAYRINKGPATGFWVPARGETMNIMFHSCNGFSLAVNPHQFSGPDPLWRDVLNAHQVRPFHVMLGGGDQIYNDAAMRDTKLFADWLQMKNPEHKHRADFSPEMQDELESFYLERYAMWFSQGLFGMANSQIPMVNIWDDHDIIDGFGSYPHHFMSTRVFTGLGAVAFKYYMLFQHHSVTAETTKEEPSWLLGASPGPYINELSRSIFLHLGSRVAFLGLDCRTERMRDEILSQETYDLVFDRLRIEITNETKHLIVLLGVPIAYPRLNFLENILTSKMMDPIKAIGRAGLLGGFVNKFDGGVEILDDLDDHWTAKHHKAERNWFIQELQELAAEKSVRITILGGDVHLGAVGQFYTPKKFGVSKDRDHRYMPNIISSAIVNTPPPPMMADVLNKRNKVHHLDEETDEDMIPMFEQDVDRSKRNNRHLLPRRNYCTIREFVPGSTPPASPGPHEGRAGRAGGTPSLDGGGEGGMFSPSIDEREGRDRRRYPPGSMKRTMSLTRGPMKLVRRLSGSGRSGAPAPSTPLAAEHAPPYSSHDRDAEPALQRSSSLGGQAGGSYFPPGGGEQQQPQQRPTNQFHRRPTTLSVKEARKAASKGGADGAEDGREAGHIDLQGGLDISLRMEIDQKDPSGETVQYRLLVPALWYEGEGDPNTMRLKGKGGGGFLGHHTSPRQLDGREQEHDEESQSGEEEELAQRPPPSRGKSFMDRFRGRGAGAARAEKEREQGQFDGQQDDMGSEGSYSGSPTPSPPPPMTAKSGGGFGRWGSLVNRAQPSRDGRGPYGNGGVESDRRAVSDQHHQHQHQQPQRHEAYEKGYTLASPPLGSAQPSRGPPNANNNPYPQSTSSNNNNNNNRRSSAPQRSNEPWRAHTNTNNADEYSQDSLTPSDEYVDDKFAEAGRQNMQTQARRPSKAERFFGIGDEAGGPWGRSGSGSGGGGGGGGRRPSGGVEQEGDYYDGEEGGMGKKKAGWKIWK